MIRYLILLFLFPIFVQAQVVGTIGVLFDSLKTHPQTLSDQINMDKANAGKNIAYGNLYPKINLFGKYDWASDPTGMRPLTLNEMFPMIQNQTIPQPFSENIMRAGAVVSMPIFVKSIYTMASKAKMMYKSAEAKKYINLLKNEAIIVSANANIQFIENMKNALSKKRESISKTKEIIDIKVNEGRAPESALLKISSALNQISIAQNDLDIKLESAKKMVTALTGVSLIKSVPMEQIGKYSEGEIKALDPLRKKMEADRLAYRAEKEKLWPVLVLNGNYNHSWADAYNNNLPVEEDFTMASLTLAVPLFSMSQYSKITKAGLDYESTAMELKKMDLELRSQAEQLKRSLPLIKNSIQLYKNSVNDKQELLDISKVAYQSGRMPIEDYLKYEDDLLFEEANLFKAQAEDWQTTMKLAVIFGNNIERIVK